MTDKREKGEKTACTPKLLPSSPKKSHLGEWMSLALLHCLLIQCSLCITCSQLVVEEKNQKISQTRQVPWLKRGSMQPKTKDQTAQIHP